MRSARHGQWKTATLALLLGQMLARGAEEEPKLDLAIWDKSLTLRGAFGYKDNVLLSKFDRQGSAFWQTSLDATLLRVDLESEANLTLFLTAEDRRYLSTDEVNKEQLLLTQGKYEQPFLEEWFASATVQYMYVDQVFDASATEQLFQTLPVKSHNLQFAPSIGRKLPWDTVLELKFVAERQYFNEPLDDYWELGPQLSLTKKYGHKSEASVSYTFDHRAYDTRGDLEASVINAPGEESQLSFEPVPGTSLEYWQHEFELAVNHSWDAARHWRSRVRFLFEINEDGGSGFYDYNRYRVSHRFGYYGKDWLATIEGKILHYDYRLQPVSVSGETRSNWEYVVALHAEKDLWKKMGVFGDVEREVVSSNFALEEYKVLTVTGGVDWDF